MTVISPILTIKNRLLTLFFVFLGQIDDNQVVIKFSQHHMSLSSSKNEENSKILMVGDKDII